MEALHNLRLSILKRLNKSLPELAAEIKERCELDPEMMRNALQKDSKEWIKVMALFAFPWNEEVKELYKEKLQSHFQQYAINKRDHFMLQDILADEDRKVNDAYVWYRILHIYDSHITIGKPYIKEKIMKFAFAQAIPKEYKKSMEHCMKNYDQYF